MRKNTRKTGFTLIEMLVTIAIMLIITGAGIASFMKFNDKQIVQTTVSELQTMMRSAQIKAKVGEDAGKCRNDFAQKLSLRSYRVFVQAGTHTATLYAVCTENKFIPFGTTELIQRDEKQFPTSISITSGSNNDLNVEFLSLLGGVDGYDTITITGPSDYTYVFEVKKSGEIIKGDFE